MKNKILTLVLLCSATFFAQTYPEMIKVQGGTFQMGDDQGIGEAGEQPVHSVTLKTFSIAKTETTVLQYKTYCNATGRKMPEQYDLSDKHPIAYVSFDEVNAYCNWLSEATGKNYRLPTEAEWEYAARGGAKSRGYTYAGSDDLEEVGWSKENSRWKIQECGRKKANELGIYDMSGNVYEWCKDWGGVYSSSSATNPIGPTSGSRRVLRGGGLGCPATGCRVASRNFNTPNTFDVRFGFRVVSPE